jgi:hypothetical protein
MQRIPYFLGYLGKERFQKCNDSNSCVSKLSACGTIRLVTLYVMRHHSLGKAVAGSAQEGCEGRTPIQDRLAGGWDSPRR